MKLYYSLAAASLAASVSASCELSDIESQMSGNPSNYLLQEVTSKTGKQMLKITCKKPKNKIDGKFKDVLAYKKYMKSMKDGEEELWGRFKCSSKGEWIAFSKRYGQMGFCPNTDQWADFEKGEYKPIAEKFGCVKESLESMIKVEGWNVDNYNFEDKTDGGMLVTCKPPKDDEKAFNKMAYKAAMNALKAATKEKLLPKWGDFKCSAKNEFIPVFKNMDALKHCPGSDEWKKFWNLLQENMPELTELAKPSKPQKPEKPEKPESDDDSSGSSTDAFAIGAQVAQVKSSLERLSKIAEMDFEQMSSYKKNKIVAEISESVKSILQSFGAMKETMSRNDILAAVSNMKLSDGAKSVLQSLRVVVQAHVSGGDVMSALEGLFGLFVGDDSKYLALAIENFQPPSQGDESSDGTTKPDKPNQSIEDDDDEDDMDKPETPGKPAESNDEGSDLEDDVVCMSLDCQKPNKPDVSDEDDIEKPDQPDKPNESGDVVCMSLDCQKPDKPDGQDDNEVGKPDRPEESDDGDSDLEEEVVCMALDCQKPGKPDETENDDMDKPGKPDMSDDEMSENDISDDDMSDDDFSDNEMSEDDYSSGEIVDDQVICMSLDCQKPNVPSDNDSNKPSDVNKPGGLGKPDNSNGSSMGKPDLGDLPANQEDGDYSDDIDDADSYNPTRPPAPDMAAVTDALSELVDLKNNWFKMKNHQKRTALAEIAKLVNTLTKAGKYMVLYNVDMPEMEAEPSTMEEMFLNKIMDLVDDKKDALKNIFKVFTLNNGVMLDIAMTAYDGIIMQAGVSLN